VKFAALEAHYHTQPEAPIVLGGIPDDETRSVRGGIEIPFALSLLAARSLSAEVPGLTEVPRELWPNTRIVHWAFDIMVACGLALLGLAVWTGAQVVRGRAPEDSQPLLRAAVIAGPLGFVAIEAGWVVTEVGRQPWIIQGIMRTADAVTPMPRLAIPFVTFALLYLVLSVVLVFALRDQFLEAHGRVPPPVEAADAD
jgi:cytochrome d ubiquinol oxidase subunit I